jgi:hypothetical protein
MVKSNVLTITVKEAAPPVEIVENLIHNGNVALVGSTVRFTGTLTFSIPLPTPASFKVDVYLNDSLVGSLTVSADRDSTAARYVFDVKVPSSPGSCTVYTVADSVMSNVFTINVITGYYKLSVYAVDLKGNAVGRVMVYVNDVSEGYAPLTLDVVEGTYKVYVEPLYPWYVFQYWSDGVRDNPRMVNVTGDTSLTAVFKYVSSLGVSSADQYGAYVPCEVYVDGRYVGDAPVTVWDVEGRHSVEVRCKVPGYTWWKWSDDVKDNPRTIDIYGQITLIALWWKT